jgi:hypothetical protein
MSDKKPFKDTAFGKLLIEKLPEVAAQAGEFLPDSGALGVIKNIITSQPEEKISAPDKLELLKEAHAYELSLEAEDSKRIESFNELEKVQVSQEDLFTKRARPARQYFWLLFLLVCYPLSWFIYGKVMELPDIVLAGIFGDFGFYSFLRTKEKKDSLAGAAVAGGSGKM